MTVTAAVAAEARVPPQTRGAAARIPAAAGGHMAEEADRSDDSARQSAAGWMEVRCI